MTRGAVLVASLALASLSFPAAAETATHDVAVVDDAYDDGEGDRNVTQATVGDEVVWRWADENEHPHTVTALDGSFESDAECGDDPSPCRRPGHVFSHVFPQPGTYRYRCEVHLTMAGTVEVQATSDDGTPPPAPSDEPPAEGTPTPSSTRPTPRATTGDRSGTPSERPRDRRRPTPRPTPTAGDASTPPPTYGSAPSRSFPGLEFDPPTTRRPRDVVVAPPTGPSPSFEPFPPPPAPSPDDEVAIAVPTGPRRPGRAAIVGVAAGAVLASAAAVARVVLRS